MEARQDGLSHRAQYRLMLLDQPNINFLPIVAAAFIAILIPVQAMSQNGGLKVKHAAKDFSVTALDDPAWKKADEIAVKTYWSGEEAPKGRYFKARLLWSDTALYVRFEAAQTEPLIVSEKPDLSKKVKGLWDRDVCEI